MDHQFLSILSAGVLLLVTAIALATPGMKEETHEKSIVSWATDGARR
jgi:hypothetical protein